MANRDSSPKQVTRPTILGTGLVALDVLLIEGETKPPKCYAGGTCGNVLAILGFLGWNSAPICRLADGEPSQRIISDLELFGVSSKYVDVSKGGSTPIIIHKISCNSAGLPRHSFSWRCPGCGSYLPGYKPVLSTTTQEIAESSVSCQVFFFDRVSRGALNLAHTFADAGAVIVFEPSGIGDPRLFKEAWKVSHVIKYSHERIRDIADLNLKQSEKKNVLIEIETLGEEGLRFKSRLPKCNIRGWQSLNVLKPNELKDSAGSGDWCTAGILQRIATTGLKGLQRCTSEALESAIRFGQALAAWNCEYQGARGGMYKKSREALEHEVKRILIGNEIQAECDYQSQTIKVKPASGFCPTCKGEELTRKPPREVQAANRG